MECTFLKIYSNEYHLKTFIKLLVWYSPNRIIEIFFFNIYHSDLNSMSKMFIKKHLLFSTAIITTAISFCHVRLFLHMNYEFTVIFAFKADYVDGCNNKFTN